MTRNTHDRLEHFGTYPSNMVDLVPTIATASTITEFIELLNDEIGHLEAVGRTRLGKAFLDAIVLKPVSRTFTLRSVVRVTRTGSFTLNSSIGFAVAGVSELGDIELGAIEIGGIG